MITITDYNKNRTVQVNENLTESSNGVHEQLLEISKRTYHTYHELLNRFSKNNWEPIQITMKATQEILQITPVSQTSTISQLSDVEYWLVKGSSMPYLSTESLIDLAISLVDYKNLLDDANEQKAKLKEYYQKHIQGHTIQEYQTGWKYIEDARTFFDNNPSLQSSHDFYQWVIKEFPNVVHTTNKKQVEAAIQLAYVVEEYNDWFKDYYGYRPRFNHGVF